MTKYQFLRFNGEDHGRNELIAIYVWSAYCLTLPEGELPDVKLWRKRKQVQSHTQTIQKMLEEEQLALREYMVTWGHVKCLIRRRYCAS